MARQVPVAFQDLAVRFSEDEWRLLGEKQRALFLDVMQENYETLVSLGTAELPPLSAFLSPTEPGGPMEDGSCSGDRQERPRGGSPLSGAPQHSLHLTALVQLVKEIPEFLFGEVSPQSGGAGLDGEGASPEAAVMEDTCPLQGPLGCLPDTPISRPGLAATPSGSSSSGPSGARGQGSPFPTETADKPRSVEEEGPAAPGGEPSPPTCSPGRRKSRGNRERGPPGAGAAEISPGNSPLQGLINCLKEILEPGPQPSEGPLGVPHPVPTGASRLTRAELGPASPPWAVKTEAASGDCPLQGLLNCLKEIPEPRDRHPSPSAAGDSRLQEDPAAWNRSSGGPRPLQTPPPGPGPGPGAGSVLSVVKTEDGWAPSLLLPVSCQLSKQMHSPTAAGSPGDSGDTTRVQVSCWGPAAQEPASKPSPLHCLENSLKGILPGGPLRFACLASPSASTSASPGSSFSSSEGEDLRPEPELWQPLLPERDRLPSCKGLGPLSLRPGGPCARSSPGEGPKKGEPKYHCGLSAAGKAEEKTGGRSQLPWREVCSETPGQPGPLGSTGGGTAVDPCPAPQLEKRRGPEPCQPPGSAHGPLSWKPRASEESRGLGPGDGRPVVTARTGGRPLPRSLPEPPAVATVPPALPLACPQPPCPCGSSLQQELCSLGAALLEKLDRLEVALAGLSQEVAAVRTQVDRLGGRPRGPGPKGLPRGPRWASSPARRHLPYWRQKGPTRPRPKILGGPAEGIRAGDSGLPSGRLHLVPQLPPDTHPAEPSGPSSSPSQQPLSSACSSRTMLTVHHPLRHTGGCQSPPPPSVPAALPPQVAPPMTSADVERLAAVAVPTRTLNWPKDPSRLLAGFQRALEGELWGGEHRDPKWGPPDCRLHGLSPVEDASPRLPLQGASLPPPPPPAEPSPYLGREGARRLPLV
uniref:Protein KRBA1 isoform X9 n=1 Tax=Camelus bactrianus TaxID=9837 RepID=A0A9W3HHW9_CAMBA|nr:protein KRBA1 isoform X9 [Camelus bactrianus]